MHSDVQVCQVYAELGPVDLRLHEVYRLYLSTILEGTHILFTGVFTEGQDLPTSFVGHWANMFGAFSIALSFPTRCGLLASSRTLSPSTHLLFLVLLAGAIVETELTPRVTHVVSTGSTEKVGVLFSSLGFLMSWLCCVDTTSIGTTSSRSSAHQLVLPLVTFPFCSLFSFPRREFSSVCLLLVCTTFVGCPSNRFFSINNWSHCFLLCPSTVRPRFESPTPRTHSNCVTASRDGRPHHKKFMRGGSPVRTFKCVVVRFITLVLVECSTSKRRKKSKSSGYSSLRNGDKGKKGCHERPELMKSCLATVCVCVCLV